MDSENRSRSASTVVDVACHAMEEVNEVARATGHRSTRHVARRARDYIEDHYGDTIRMEDLCRFAGVSLRTLQRSFAEYFEVSPSAYIKARGLNAARQGLVADDPSRHTVTQIALDSGFAHLGRFSVDYREHFGESPSETLASR